MVYAAVSSIRRYSRHASHQRASERVSMVIHSGRDIMGKYFSAAALLPIHYKKKYSSLWFTSLAHVRVHRTILLQQKDMPFHHARETMLNNPAPSAQYSTTTMKNTGNTRWMFTLSRHISVTATAEDIIIPPNNVLKRAPLTIQRRARDIPPTVHHLWSGWRDAPLMQKVPPPRESSRRLILSPHPPP